MTLKRFIAWGPGSNGSTRAIALVRIGLALVIWARFGTGLTLHFNVVAWQLLLSTYFFVFTTFMLFGLYTRFSVFMVALCLAVFYFIFGYGGIRPEFFAHHIYLLMAVTFLLAFTPCGRSYSVDRYRAVRSARRQGLPLPPEHGNLWAQRLIVLQMASLYLWAGVDKTGAHFLSGDRLEAIFMWAYGGRPLENVLLTPELYISAAIAVVLVEYFLAVAILVRRALPVAVPIGLALHAAFYLILPLATFSITMILLYIAVLPPNAVHRMIDRLQGYEPDPHHI